MAFDKNENLAQVITGISYLYPDIPTSIVDGNDKFHKNINLPINTVFNAIYFTPGTAKFSESDKDDNAGGVIEQELKCIIPGEDDDTPSYMNAIRNRPLLIKITFGNTTKKLIGLPDNPVYLIRKQQITEKINATELTFTCSSLASAWWIDYEGIAGG